LRVASAGSFNSLATCSGIQPAQKVNGPFIFARSASRIMRIASLASA